VETLDSFERVSRYIDNNPVKAGLVAQAADWLFGGLSHQLKGIRWLLDDLWEYAFYGPLVLPSS
jgi:hypothetical protein